MNKLNLSEYINYGRKLLNEKGLEHWDIGWMPRTSMRVCGRCKCGPKKIVLNRDYYFLTPEHNVLENTIIHEVAHAIHFERYQKGGHTPEWKAIFLELGGNGQRLNKEAIMPTKEQRGLSHNRPQFDL